MKEDEEPIELTTLFNELLGRPNSKTVNLDCTDFPRRPCAVPAQYPTLSA